MTDYVQLAVFIVCIAAFALGLRILRPPRQCESADQDAYAAARMRLDRFFYYAGLSLFGGTTLFLFIFLGLGWK